MKIHYSCLLIFMAIACPDDGNKDIVVDNFEFASEQLLYAISEVDRVSAQQPAGQAVSPRTVDENGNLVLVPSTDWTSGFFPGELWLMYEYTGDEKWARQARRFTEPLEREKTNGRTHDMGFKVNCSFGNGYRLTGDMHYRDVMLEASYTLATRYHPKIKAIRSWDHSTEKWDFPVIIDNMMNLELLFSAFRETGDSTLYNIALDHARTTLQNHFREDHGTYHVVDYCVGTGAVLKKTTHQGYANETTWARGEAWALYGYTMCYRETGIPEFLEQARNVAGFIFNHPNLPRDLIPYWDFDAPGIPDEPRDVSASAVIASALYELSGYVPEMSERYKTWADNILQSLTGKYMADPGKDSGFLLLHSTGIMPENTEIDVPIVYADYYFLEALIRKTKLEGRS